MMDGMSSSPAPPSVGMAKIPVSFTLNGAPTTIELAPWTTLLDALRNHMGLTGTKKGCDPRPVRRLHGVGERRAREQPACAWP